MNIVNEDVIVKILTSHDIVTAAQITQLKWQINTNIVKAGNNYMSEVYRLTIEYVKDGKARKRVLFIKAPCNSPMYETASKWDVFVKELVMYETVFPQIHTFEEEYFTARYYHCDEKQSLFLKDLTQSGYKTGNRTQQLDFEHCAYALKCLAKLHGLSVHLEKTRGLPEVVRKDAFFNSSNQDEQIKSQFLDGLAQFYHHLDPSIQVKYSRKVDFFKTMTWEQIVADLDPQMSSFNVLNHGDYWTNNIMFKYDKYGIIKKAKMLDFQISRWSNPATDLIYFTISSMRYDVYQEHFDLLCTIYLDTLNKILTKFNYRNYEMADLKKDIESRYKYGILVLTCTLPFILSDPDDPINLKEVVKNNEFDTKAVHKTYKQKKYLEVATRWFLHFAQKDIPGFEDEPVVPINGNALQFVNGIREEIS